MNIYIPLKVVVTLFQMAYFGFFLRGFALYADFFDQSADSAFGEFILLKIKSDIMS